jgi:hypothetical protein
MLLQSDSIRHKAVGSFLFDLIDKASASGSGFSKRKMAKQGSIYLTDPKILGYFRVCVTDPGFASLFVSRANK